MSASQTLLLGRHADRVQAGWDQLHSQHWIERLWEGDASLWSSDAKTQAIIRNRLGWLRIASVMEQQVEPLRAYAQQVRRVGRTHALLLGMGGSGLFAEVCRNLFGVTADGADLLVLDTTDPTAIRSAQARCPLSRLIVIISSKSGTTTEVSALSRYFYEALRAAGATPGEHCIGITDDGTPLAAQAKQLKFSRIFLHGPQSGADVGGRFSALTYFGLVPAALMGIDVGRLLHSAKEMLARCGAKAPLRENPAAHLGAVLGALAQVGRDKLTFLAASPLASFGIWVEQLVAESTGKSGRGIVPIVGEPLQDVGAYESDRVFVELQLGSQVDSVMERHAAALAEAGHPVVRMVWNDTYDVGGEVTRWSLATVIAGGLLGINPFDEPNVEESKDLTKALLEQLAREGGTPKEEQPTFSHAQVAVYGAPGVGKPLSLNQCLSEFFQRLRPSDYIALLSFLSRTASRDGALQALRGRIASRSGHATILQFGPRYLHSTGQLYKGGPDAGVFLLFTADEHEDLPIPGEPFTFSVLKQAQALGDFQAMQQRGRRILRMHLRGNVEAAVQKCLSAVDEITTLRHAGERSGGSTSATL